MFETFEHTADIGLRIEADSVEELFVEAARGLSSLIVERLENVRPERLVRIELQEEGLDYLLFDWMNELLFQFDTTGVVCSAFEVRLSGNRLQATASGEPLNEQRHGLSREVKAITYHELAIHESDGRWSARVIVDI